MDLLRFHEGLEGERRIVGALSSLTGKGFGRDEVLSVAYTDWLLQQDVRSPPGYLRWKRAAFLAVDPSWRPFFDPDADLDWREVSWGGVLRDRIPALQDPPVVPAGRGGWIADDEVVFGVTVEEESRAYPLRVMEVHELVNDTLGGRPISVPYCTLCGSAIAYVTDEVPGGPLRFRTSGLLQRSNKLMYDVETESLWHQFFGVGLTGPMRGVELERAALSVAAWGDWRAAHPDTTIIAEGAGTGFDYRDRELPFERSDAPIFPVGPIDDRLPPKAIVLGAESPRGVAVAFPVDPARAALGAGEEIAAGGVALTLEEGLLVARPEGGGPALLTHEAFWFAWSQFRPDTKLWTA